MTGQDAAHYLFHVEIMAKSVVNINDVLQTRIKKETCYHSTY